VSSTSGPLTLHAVTDVPRLRQLATRMDNCLAGYGDRLSGRHRIVEVRQAGRTRYAIHIASGRIVTFEAAGNRRPDPADVPVVRALLEREGHLASTRVPDRPAHHDPRQLRLPSPGGAPAPEARRTADRRRPPRPPHPSVPGPPAPPPAPAGISLQQLATEFLAPPTLRSPDWTEVATALWASGWLPRLPDPANTAAERPVRDLATRIATGDEGAIPRVAPPTSGQREAVRRRLLEPPAGAHDPGWRRRRMAAVLTVPITP
jgi:hypothetical protein